MFELSSDVVNIFGEFVGGFFDAIVTVLDSIAGLF
ncbi:hypothetical protein CETAM_01085 [Corynebacterium comes]|uniref:Uncharacterized protein n=1 Tax=Corynebacterium comes TaxID=2675218 RepID=A0A6B8W1K5_9CORY|nr:hypothetical protein CETAM_01085 [Corynebacterium comes]